MINLIYTIIIVFICLNILLTIILIIKKNNSSKRKKLSIIIKNEFQMVISKKESIQEQKNIKKFPLNAFDIYQNITERIELDQNIKNQIISFFISTKKIYKQTKLIKSKNKFKRCRAATFLSFLPQPFILEILEARLSLEKNTVVKKYMVQGLSRIGNISSFSVISNSVVGEDSNYINWVAEIIKKYDNFQELPFESFFDSTHNEIILLLINLASKTTNSSLKSFIDSYIINKKNIHRSEAIKSLIVSYPGELNSWKYLDDDDPLVRNQALYLFISSPTKQNLYKLINYISDKDLKDTALKVLEALMLKNPILYTELLNILINEKDQEIKKQIACILSQQSEYYLTQFLNDNEGLYHAAIEAFVEFGFSSKIIIFLNNNKNTQLEDEIIKCIKPIINNNTNLILPYQKGLNNNIKEKLSILIETLIGKREHIEKSRTKILFMILFFAIFILPGTYVLMNYTVLNNLSLIEHIRKFVLHFNFFFAYYTIILNCTYLIILLFAFVGMNTQSKFWSIKRRDHLFTKDALPSISIIAPAYCEESTIIENIHSLLTLDYPDFEVIVVNDGSTDKTLETIINYFQLKKLDTVITEELDTMPVRGIYRNPELPLLTVIDKQNGGKADSLNVGINFSKNEYFCGIDADSLLEGDSLLKLVSPKIDTIKDSIAFGGNIIPVNGCTVDKGKLEDIHIPNEFLERIQCMEYVRSYMAGRLGWATMNSLLIISGAFGLFKRELVINVGGYLTAKGKFHKDTVGEDMELVVRIVRFLEEKNRKYKVHFSYNANCWTEVPSTLDIFNRQRNRWQRGLIDIITYHLKMMFNPNYSVPGVVALPYFLIFEIVGPLFEFQGYFFFIISIFVGLLNPLVLLLLFFGSIILGVTVSLSSLIISESSADNFSKKELLKLLLIAIIENFGIRQLISLSRNIGYFSSFKKSKGWGGMKRKGFKT